LLGKEQAERAAAQSEPEILHSDLSALLLELLQWGCHDPAALAWLDQPPAVNLAAAPPAGGALGAGRRAAVGVWPQNGTLGNEPRLAAMLAAAQTDDEAATAAKLAAILEEPPRGGWWIWAPSFPVSRPTGSSARSS
jgi:ATP-dependent helicase HrpB